ncbi:MAG: Bacterial alpha-L-rhamnosidase [Phycisphaera sp.]|nr:Bacterial alpha-L-rhamnosidase [Phycisphaera sp.]
MKTEFTDAPPALGTRKPRFSWLVPFEGRGRTQSAYHVLVATDKRLLVPGKADQWDSGKVDSSQSMHVVYDGKPLRSNRDYFWTVQLWDEAGNPSGFLESTSFGTALLDDADWHAQWIGMGDPDEPVSDPDAFQQARVTDEIKAVEPDPRSPMMRKPFEVKHTVRRARAFVAGVGLFELRLNGEKVGQDLLATPRTEFRKRVLYSTYDITRQLNAGPNAVSVLLGNGWYNGHKRYWGWQQQWYGSPRAIVQLEIEYHDGSTQRVVSDGSWRGDWSPITFNCIYDGEHYDARLEQPRWDTPAFSDAHWKNVHIVRPPGGKLKPVPHEPGRIVKTIRPVSVAQPKPGVYVFDFGVNMTGHVRLNLKDDQPGQTVTLRYAEAQHPDGSLNPASNNKALQTDRYTPKGQGREVYEPRFTYHGFQYVEVTGYPGTPTLDSVTGCFACNAVEEVGSFECGHDLVNKVHRCTVQSQRCNIQMGVPTDDTQRPERLGWAGDAWSYAEEAYYNFAVERVFAKWVGDFYDQQDEHGLVGMIAPQAGAEEDLVWSAAFVLVPWWQYLHRGDKRILEESYPYLEKYMDYLVRTGLKDVQPEPSDKNLKKLRHWCPYDERFPDESRRGHLQISQWGDHLATNEGAMGARNNQPLSIASAFYYMDVNTMALIAQTLGKTDDAQKYRDRAGQIKDTFNTRFYNSAWGYYDTGSQNAQAWPLAFGLVPDSERGRVESYLNSSVNHRQRCFTTGYAGTKWAVHAVAQSGRDEFIWNRVIATDYPSWGYMLRDPKRTTITENWIGGGSLCHTTLGAAIDEWFYWGLAGIRPDAEGPGYERIIFKPYLPAELPWAKASIKTLRGTVASSWEHDGQSASWQITVPANCTATVHVPCKDPEQITEGRLSIKAADHVEHVRSDERASVFTVGSGRYHFAFPIQLGATT